MQRIPQKLPPFASNKIRCKSETLNSLKMACQPSCKRRPTCPNCSKPLILCLCTRFKTQKLYNNIHVTILQHSLEVKHPLNSARIAKLGLNNVAVFVVTDVNFEARFNIRLLHLGAECTPGVCGNASESLGSVGSAEGTMCRKRDFGEVGLDVGSDLDSGSGSSEGDEPLLSVVVGKSGDITSVSHQWKLTDESKTCKVEHFFDSAEVVEHLTRGFVVTKLQKKKKNGSVELEEFKEFEVTVPPGSALLFPSENAVAVEGIGFQVKNLIVLDGTWSKAKRMYLENPWLRVLPCVKLDVEKMSLFNEVRRQPKPQYLSTVESIVYALEGLGETENLPGLRNLLEVFESMVEDQRRYKDEKLAKLSST